MFVMLSAIVWARWCGSHTIDSGVKELKNCICTVYKKIYVAEIVDPHRDAASRQSEGAGRYGGTTGAGDHSRSSLLKLIDHLQVFDGRERICLHIPARPTRNRPPASFRTPAST